MPTKRKYQKPTVRVKVGGLPPLTSNYANVAAFLDRSGYQPGVARETRGATLESSRKREAGCD